MTHVSSLLRRIPPAVFRLVLLALLLLPSGQAETAQPPASVQHAAEAAYQKTADQCHRLLNSPSLGGNREDWLKEIQELERIYRQQPQGSTASAALHLHARMRQAMHQQFRQAADLDQAVALFSNVVSLFPKSNEAAESLFALAQIEQNRGNLRGAAKTYYKLAHGYPFSSRKRQAEEQLRQLTIIAESLAARKDGRKPAPLPPTQPAPAVKAAVPPVVSLPKPVVAVPQLAPKLENKPQEKLILSVPVEPSKPVLKPVVSIPPAAPAITIQPTTIAAQPAPVPEKKPQETIVLPAAPTKPAPPAAEKKNEEPSLLSRLIHPDFSFSLFGSDEEKKEPVKPAASAPAPEKIAAAPVPPPKEPEPTAKIVVSELKIASLEQEKKAALPEPPQPKPEPKPLPPPIEVKPEPEKAPVIAAAPPLKEEKTEPPKSVLAELLPIQHWSSDNYNRVAVSTSRLAAYQAILPEKGGKLLRLEFKQSHVGPELRLPLTVDKGLLKSIRTEQTDEQTVQVSLELAEEAESKIFSLNDPFRVVVDLHKAAASPVEENTAAADSPKELTEQEKKARLAAVKEQIKLKPKAAEKHSLTLAQQLGLGIKRIMIDPGHGGKDSGATGFSLEEKNIVLDVAKRVRELLKKEHYEVLLTRETDIFIPLEERTAIANTKGADLFLSIHVNAHPSATVKGVETYYLNLAANPEAMRVAALENATSSRSMSEMEDILTSLMKNSKINESSLFAEFVQTSMTDGLRRYKVKDLGVKKAPFYVLIGAQMPAALAEISFISNKEEAELLKSEQYLQAVAKRIAVGVVAYIEHRRSEVTAATQH